MPKQNIGFLKILRKRRTFPIGKVEQSSREEQVKNEVTHGWVKKSDMNILNRERRKILYGLAKDEDEEAILASYSQKPGR